MTSQGFDWKGMNVKMTPIGDMPGIADYQLNTSMFTENELWRRRGMAAGTMDPRSAGIIGLATVFTPNGSVVAQQTPGDLWGFGPGVAVARWTDAILIPPIGFTPVAPVITVINSVPGSPGAYPAALVTFTATITYDGLSGALIYSWGAMNQLGAPFSFVTPNTGNANPCSYSFGAGNPPDFYSAVLTVTTTLNGFSTNRTATYTIM